MARLRFEKGNGLKNSKVREERENYTRQILAQTRRNSTLTGSPPGIRRTICREARFGLNPPTTCRSRQTYEQRVSPQASLNRSLDWSGNEAIDGNGGLTIIWRRKMRISASTVRLAKVLYVSNWYVFFGLLWGSDILIFFPYEGGVEEPLVY